MATASLIGVKDGDKVKYVYCNFDGYLDGVGKMLHKHYQDIHKVEYLIAKGGFESLEKSPEDISYYDDYDSYSVCDYGKYCNADSRIDIGYVYLFDESFEEENDNITEPQWFYSKPHKKGDCKWKPISSEIKDDDLPKDSGKSSGNLDTEFKQAIIDIRDMMKNMFTENGSLKVKNYV